MNIKDVQTYLEFNIYYFLKLNKELPMPIVKSMRNGNFIYSLDDNNELVKEEIANVNQ